MANEKIRRAARVADVALYKIATEIGISEPTFMRWLRYQLPPEKENAVLDAIKRLSTEECEGNG